MQTQTNFDHLPGYATRWKGLFFIGISLLVISLDNTILNVALPSISRSLDASAGDLQWIIDAYSLVFASLLLTMGAASDRLGRKRSLQVGMVMFGIGSAAAGLSTSVEMLVAARAFLGIGAAIIMPSTLSIISGSFPPNERPQAFAIWAAVFGMGVGIGPVVGGWLLEHYEWNAAFFINIPVAIIAVAGGALYLAESKDEHAPKLDLPGVFLSITGLFALIYGIIEAGSKGWTHDTVLVAFGAAIVLLGAFAWWENRNPDAMLPLYFFRNMSFTGANTALALVTFSLFGSIFFLSQFLQSVLGYTALESGIRLLPLAITLTIVSASSARVAEYLGTKIVVAVGIAIAGGGLFIMSQIYDANSTYMEILLPIVVFSAGMGLVFSPATNSIMQSVPVSKAGIGSAMNDTTRELGGALGVAVLGTVLNSAYLDGVEPMEAMLQLPPEASEAISSSIQGAHIVALGLPPELQATVINTANAAFVDGMSEAMFVGSMIMFATALLTLVLLPNKVRRPDEDAEEGTASGSEGFGHAIVAPK